MTIYFSEGVYIVWVYTGWPLYLELENPCLTGFPGQNLIFFPDHRKRRSECERKRNTYFSY